MRNINIVAPDVKYFYRNFLFILFYSSRSTIHTDSIFNINETINFLFSFFPFFFFFRFPRKLIEGQQQKKMEGIRTVRDLSLSRKKQFIFIKLITLFAFHLELENFCNEKVISLSSLVSVTSQWKSIGQRSCIENENPRIFEKRGKKQEKKYGGNMKNK